MFFRISALILTSFSALSVKFRQQLVTFQQESLRKLQEICDLCWKWWKITKLRDEILL